MTNRYFFGQLTFFIRYSKKLPLFLFGFQNTVFFSNAVFPYFVNMWDAYSFIFRCHSFVPVFRYTIPFFSKSNFGIKESFMYVPFFGFEKTVFLVFKTQFVSVVFPYFVSMWNEYSFIFPYRSFLSLLVQFWSIYRIVLRYVPVFWCTVPYFRKKKYIFGNLTDNTGV